MRDLTDLSIFILVFTVLYLALSSLGIEVDKKSSVIIGNSDVTTSPASVDYDLLVKQTDEYKIIIRDGVKEGSARYILLISEASSKVKDAITTVAKSSNIDCVVKKGSVTNSNGLKVKDITDEVKKLL